MLRGLTVRSTLSIAFVSCLLPLMAADADQPKDKRWPRVRFGGMVVNAGYTRYSGYPFGYGFPYGYGYHDPFFYSPYIHPGFYTGFGFQPAMGQVKIQTPERDAWVYLDGALAGRADKLKTMWLEPGKYTVELRRGDRSAGQNIYVLSGKTLKVTPEMLKVKP